MNTNFDDREKLVLQDGPILSICQRRFVCRWFRGSNIQQTKELLLDIGELDWQKINPDIFGSMIQAVADDEERGELGMHYTSVPNIPRS